MLQYLMAVLTAGNEEEGQGLVEYALIIVLVAIAVIGALTIVGENVEGTFNDIADGLTGGN
ncbi:MAG TPA: Flp family type IVb pilin [Thermomicrobiales bacterium]|nr:Flp family type IVb pilin [Thermomicrobiales bacterium]